MSTNVHQNSSIYLVGGQTIPLMGHHTIQIPPKSAGKGPSIHDVEVGEIAIIPVADHSVIRDDNGNTIGRATADGKILSGNSQAINKALGKNSVAREH